MNKLSILSMLMILFFSACTEEVKSLATDEAAGPEPIAITDYSEQTELFVEFDPFVVNSPSTFLAHFTYMDTFKPFKEGQVEACLSFSNETKECFSVDAPAFEGIFKPVATPTQSGDAKLSITIKLGSINVTHELGTFKVYESIAQIPLSKEEEDDSISYLKEQQWKVEFATQIVKKRLLRESISTFAKIEIPHNNTYILSAPVSGILTLKEGITVGTKLKKNMTVAYITPRLGEKEDISTLKFELKKANTNLTLKKYDYERLQKLKAKNAVSQNRLVVAEQKYEMAKAQLSSVNQRLTQFDTGSNMHLALSLKNQIADGTINKLLALSGSYVNEGDTIAHIINAEELWLNINIPQNDISKITKPLGAELLTNEHSLVFNAGENSKFLYFTDTIDPTTRTASLLFEIDNTSSSLKAGAIHASRVYTGKTVEALAIPKSAIINDNGQHVVYIQTGGESFERRIVQTGLSDSGYIAVYSGVNEGEHIASKGVYEILLSSISPAAAGSGHAH